MGWCESTQVDYALVSTARMSAPFFIALLCLALVLNLLGFMTVAAVLPQLIHDWSLTSTEVGWLGGIYFAGYVAAVPVLEHVPI